MTIPAPRLLPTCRAAPLPFLRKEADLPAAAPPSGTWRFGGRGLLRAWQTRDAATYPSPVRNWMRLADRGTPPPSAAPNGRGARCCRLADIPRVNKGRHTATRATPRPAKSDERTIHLETSTSRQENRINETVALKLLP